MFVKPNPFYKRPKTRGWERIFKLMYKQLGINRTAYIPVVNDNGDPAQVHVTRNATGIPIVDAFNAIKERKGETNTIEAEQYPMPAATDLGDIMEVEQTVRKDEAVTQEDFYDNGDPDWRVEETKQSNEDAAYFEEYFRKQKEEVENLKKKSAEKPLPKKIKQQPKKQLDLPTILNDWKEKVKENKPEVIDLVSDSEDSEESIQIPEEERNIPFGDNTKPFTTPETATDLVNNLTNPAPPIPEELEMPKLVEDDFDKFFEAKFGFDKKDEEEKDQPIKEIKKMVKDKKISKKMPKKKRETMEATARVLQDLLLKEYADIITVKMVEEEGIERKDMTEEKDEEEMSEESIDIPEVTLDDVAEKRPSRKRGHDDTDLRQRDKGTVTGTANQYLLNQLRKSKIEERKREIGTFEAEIRKLARTTNQYKLDLQGAQLYKEELRQLQEEIFNLYNEYEDMMGYSYDDQLEQMEKDEVGEKKIHLDKDLDDAMDEILEDKTYIEYFDLYEKLNQLIDKRDQLVEKLFEEYGEVKFWKELGVTKDQMIAVLLGHEDDNVYHVLEVVLPVIGHYSSIIQDINRDLKFMITYGPPTFEITIPDNEKEFIVGEYWAVYAWALQHDKDMATSTFKRERRNLYKAVFGDLNEKDKKIGLEGRNIEDMEIPENILYKWNYVQYFPNTGRLRYISVSTKSNQNLRIKNKYLDGIDETHFILKASKITDEAIKAELLVDESTDRLARTVSVNRYKNLILNGLILLYSTKNQEATFWQKMNNYVQAIIQGSTVYKITPGKIGEIINDSILIGNVAGLLTKENIKEVITKNISYDPSQQTIPSGKMIR